MRKILTICAISTLGLLLITSMTGTKNGFDIFMSSTPLHDGMRVVLMAALSITLVFQLSRRRVVRAVLAYTSAVVTVFALASAVAGELQIFDTLSYILAAVILMTEAIEEEAIPARVAEIGRPKPLRHS